MNKNYFLLFLLSPFTFGQVGVNTDDPQATMEIKATNPTGTSTKNEGVIIPHITRERAFSMSNPVESTLVYISEAATGNAIGKTEDVDEKGHYYFNGTKWVKLKSSNLLPSSNNYINAISHDQNTNLVKLGGNLIEPTTIFTDEENTLSITGDYINAFSVDGTTFSVDGKNNRIGIGTATPAQALDVVGKIKIADGTQDTNKILTSDENGVASWKASKIGEVINGSFTKTTFEPGEQTGKIYNLANLTLTEKGTYLISFRIQTEKVTRLSNLYNSYSSTEDFSEGEKDSNINGSIYQNTPPGFSNNYYEYSYIYNLTDNTPKIIYLKIYSDEEDSIYHNEDNTIIFELIRDNINLSNLSYFKATRLSN